MEYVNDEMDDLFRKAGEQYPLKTSDSDWDAVLGRLHTVEGSESSPLMQNGKKRNNNRRFFWLLLLLPLGLFSLKYFQGPQRNDNGRAKLVEQSTTKPAISSKNSHAMAAQANRVSDSSANAGAVITSHLISPNGEHSAKKKIQSANGDQITLASSGRSTNTIDNRGQELSSVSGGISKPDKQTPPPGEAKTVTMSSVNKPATGTSIPGSAGEGNEVSDKKSKQAAAREQNNKPDSSDQKDKRKTKVPDSGEKGIYVSLMAGPDFSTVKFQSVKKTGYSIGLLAGYRFNKHISAEAGLFWDEKQYYSDGKYFNKSKTGLPASVNIEDLNGTCNMFEIPVSFRYDFSFNRKGRFFSTAGLATYLMKKESYFYNADNYGSGWSRDLSYKNSGNNFFSILQLTAGYEYNWGKIGRIRIEPYLKVPLTGVGIGQLPISSAGLHLGITHSFR